MILRSAEGGVAFLDVLDAGSVKWIRKDAFLNQNPGACDVGDDVSDD